MKPFLKLFILFIIPLVTGCIDTHTAHEAISDTTLVSYIDTASEEIDTNQYLYDFIRIVEKDQKLDHNYGLTLEVESLVNNTSDEAYLTKFIKRVPEKKSYSSKQANNVDSLQTVNGADTPLSIKIPELFISSSQIIAYPDYACLTKSDIKYMIAEKNRLKNFTWDNKKLGFTIQNKNNWYVFSLPYFSKDKKTVIISIRSLCNGLCGNGYVLVYQLQNDTWTSSQIDFWIH